MPKFRVLETSFIDNVLWQPGSIVEYAGEPSSNLETVSDKTILTDPRNQPLEPEVTLPLAGVSAPLKM